MVDIDLLESIKNDYALNGEFSQFGEGGHGTFRSAIARYVEFMRSILNVCNKFELKRQIQPTNRQVDITVNNNQLDINSESIFINNITIPTHPNQNETFQNYIKRLMRLLFDNNLLTKEDILNLKDVEYCRNTFNLQFAMIVDINGDFERKRYWVGTLFNNQFYVCSQWWRDNFPTYQTHTIQWLLYLKTQR